MRYKRFILITICLLFVMVGIVPVRAATFTIPTSRAITWAGNAGLDLEGGIPTGWSNCTTAACNTLWGGSVSTATINSALSSAPSNSVVRIPTGTHTVSGTVNMQSDVILRGLGRLSTILNLNFTGAVSFSSILPCRGGTLAACGNTWNITSEPDTAGQTSLTLQSGHTVAQNDYVLIYMNNPTYVSGSCSWCGWEPDTAHMIGHWAKVTSVSGTTINIDPALMFDIPTGLDAEVLPTSPSDWISWAGLEDLKLLNGDDGTGMIYFRGARHSWVKDVETQNAGDGNAASHVLTDSSGTFAIEVRDSFFRKGCCLRYTGGENYAFLMFGFNTAWKIENNRIHNVRHTIVFEGPTAGTAVLYNYDHGHRQDDDGVTDEDYLGESMLNNHGLHGVKNLWEGNYTTRYGSDSQFGSSSHTTWFRNYARGNKPVYAWVWGQWTVDLWQDQQYMNFVGNVLGNDADFDPVDYYQNDAGGEMAREPAIWQLGGDGCCSFGNANTKNTLLRHMNYDYVSEASRTCNQEDEGCQGATSGNTDLVNSLYYSSEPTWWQDQSDAGECRPWPTIGPDISGYYGDIPAKDRYEGQTYSGVNCGSPPGLTGTPSGGPFGGFGGL